VPQRCRCDALNNNAQIGWELDLLAGSVPR
jgi:hypothetical protein